MKNQTSKKTRKSRATHSAFSRIVTFRLPYDLECAIKDEAKIRGRRWQTVLKELLKESLGISDGESLQVKRISATALRAASFQLLEKRKIFP